MDEEIVDSRTEDLCKPPPPNSILMPSAIGGDSEVVRHLQALRGV